MLEKLKDQLAFLCQNRMSLEDALKASKTFEQQGVHKIFFML